MAATREARPEDDIPPEASAILAGLEGRIARPPVRPLYRVGLVLVALAMVALPLLYVALVAAVGAGIWLAVDAMTESWKHPTAGIVIVSILGGTVVLFLVKPLLAKPGRASARKPLALRRDRHPLLFAFVDKLCDAVGAPRPKEIRADCDLNASAGFHGRGDLVRGSRVLTVGLPLMAGMSLSQFAGVLAHEFGHFAQGTGTRLSWLIRTINQWFARVVYERDAWDARLDGMTKIWGWTS